MTQSTLRVHKQMIQINFMVEIDNKRDGFCKATKLKDIKEKNIRNQDWKHKTSATLSQTSSSEDSFPGNS